MGGCTTHLSCTDEATPALILLAMILPPMQRCARREVYEAKVQSRGDFSIQETSHPLQAG